MSGLKHGWHNRLVGSADVGNLCGRADDVVGSVAQGVERLQALEVAAVGEDELQVRHLLQHFGHGVDVDPLACLPCVVPVSQSVSLGVRALAALA